MLGVDDATRQIVVIPARHGGMGVCKKIIPLPRKASGMDPEFEATEDYLKLTMWKGPAVDE